MTAAVVDRMIRNSVRARFRTVYWSPPPKPIQRPAIVVVNHHGWFDGYLMYLALKRLELPILDWIEEFDAFPLFGALGGMPFPKDDAVARAATIRKTIRSMRQEKSCLLLFAEGVLHPPPSVLPFGKALQTVADKVDGCEVVPAAIRYDFSLHERPEAAILFGAPVADLGNLQTSAREAVIGLLAQADEAVDHRYEGMQVLVQGTQDVNERLDMRKFFRKPQ